MAIYLHPNEKSPKRLRVYDKSQKIQKYFSFKSLGVEEAWKQARKLQEKIDNKNKIHSLIDTLTINKIFHPNGKIKGLHKVKRIRKGRPDYECLRFQLRVQKHVNKCATVPLKNTSFENAYKAMKQKVLDAHGVKNSPELELYFRKAKRLHW